jgi:serine/threonine-protein kinase RsbT
MSNEPQGKGEVRIDDESHIVTVRKTIRDAAMRLGFGITDVTRNIFHYAGTGIMRWRELADVSRIGIELTFEDHGPGIADVGQAMLEGYSTSGGFGMGLPGTKRLMDEMEINSQTGRGTTIVVRKWRKK